mgnify:CR=1 FL=1
MNIFVFRFLKMSGSFYFNLFSDRETRIKIHYLWDAHAFYFLSQFVCCCCCFSSRSKNREENKKKYSTVPVQFCSYEWHRVVSVSSFCIFNVLSTFAYQVFFHFSFRETTTIIITATMETHLNRQKSLIIMMHNNFLVVWVPFPQKKNYFWILVSVCLCVCISVNEGISKWIRR